MNTVRKARGKSVAVNDFLPFYVACIKEGLSKAETVKRYNAKFGVDTSEASFTQKVQNLRETLESEYLKTYGKRFESYKANGQTKEYDALEEMITKAINDAIPPFSGERKNSAKNVLGKLVKEFDLPGMEDLSDDVAAPSAPETV